MAASPAREPDISADCRVLVVEDDAICQEIMLMMLDHLGYRGEFVADGVDAVSAVSADAYDVVLMDVQMPRMNGMEATRLIRSQLGSSHQPTIIAMTADTSPGCREECLITGMDGYLDKPVRIGQLAAVLDPGCRRIPQLELVPERTAGGGPNPEVPATVVFDDGVLRSLIVDLGGDDAMRAELITTFVFDAEARIRAILVAGEGSDLGALKFQAHAIKSASATVGLLALSEAAAAVEWAADATPGEVDVVWQASRLADECNRATEVLTAFGRG